MANISYCVCVCPCGSPSPTCHSQFLTMPIVIVIVDGLPFATANVAISNFDKTLDSAKI
ncbi:hypothetical protein COLO4_26272 [Corchorus olitorius]|uniref:Uncharacterized protein n=1 Tax=Corchorus olitorius TaxID=93759 RepID=A0A1R3HXS4_9ROSI|nr:hypothetical protein COLO4_26272 [Corchorus olitorius]